MLSIECENDILSAITDIRRKYRIFKPVSIIVSNQHILIKEVTENQEYNDSFQDGYLQGMRKAKTIFDK